ncbi:hypothetical protein GIB67_014513 [Kingdonia uniflora]|uniref:Reverse transcriptase zinc-binding domain-containing protein n=1 Tax=Kingdonia uniflora TaxID=39325 RepID=A0A7J7NMW5_9MAGN|nr:hypothetical protein GIB67_014513 [Kingdonia uniflora]
MYQEASGQVFSSEKSKLFLGAMNNEKKQVKDIFGFDEGSLPETYLGIPLIQGRVTKEILRPLVDKIKKRATGWAGSLLSIQGRAVLIKSVLRSISIYSMSIYKWHTSVIKEGERILRNFFWSREPDTKKACVVVWDKVCKLFKEGGINLRRLKEINQSLMMKVTWNFLNPKNEWSEFMRAKFIAKPGSFSTCTKGSSIWAGVRGALEDVCSNSGWVIGDGSCIDLWKDIWCSPISLKDLINNDNIPWKNLHAKVSSIIVNGRWSLPHNLLLLFHRLGMDINSIKLNTNKADRRVWKPDLVDFVMGSYPLMIDNLQKKGIYIVSRCRLCSKGAETLAHLFWNCTFSSSLWSWLETLFNICIVERNLKSLLLAGDTMSPYLKDLWIGAIWGGTKLIWHARNKKTFEDCIITLDKEKRKWSKLFHDTAFLSKGRIYNNQSDFGILRSLGVPLHPSKSTVIKSCSWELPRKG